MKYYVHPSQRLLSLLCTDSLDKDRETNHVTSRGRYTNKFEPINRCVSVRQMRHNYNIEVLPPGKFLSLIQCPYSITGVIDSIRKGWKEI